MLWDLEDGQQRLFVMTSHAGVPSVSLGSSIERQGGSTEVTLSPHLRRGSTTRACGRRRKKS